MSLLNLKSASPTRNKISVPSKKKQSIIRNETYIISTLSEFLFVSRDRRHTKKKQVERNKLREAQNQ